jgi:hypothetical protein
MGTETLSCFRNINNIRPEKRRWPRRAFNEDEGEDLRHLSPDPLRNKLKLNVRSTSGPVELVALFRNCLQEGISKVRGGIGDSEFEFAAEVYPWKEEGLAG